MKGRRASGHSGCGMKSLIAPSLVSVTVSQSLALPVSSYNWIWALPFNIYRPRSRRKIKSDHRQKEEEEEDSKLT